MEEEVEKSEGGIMEVFWRLVGSEKRKKRRMRERNDEWEKELVSELE